MKKRKKKKKKKKKEKRKKKKEKKKYLHLYPLISTSIFKSSVRSFVNAKDRVPKCEGENRKGKRKGKGKGS